MHQLLIECRFYFFLKYSYLNIFLSINDSLHLIFSLKNLFQREKFLYYFYKKLKIKKTKNLKKYIFSGFFRWFFLGFLGGFFYCQPCKGHIIGGTHRPWATLFEKIPLMMVFVILFRLCCSIPTG